MARYVLFEELTKERVDASIEFGATSTVRIEARTSRGMLEVITEAGRMKKGKRVEIACSAIERYRSSFLYPARQ
jgi:hypothetical protein